MKMTKNFDDLNDTFNTSGDVIKPEVVESKIQKVKEGVDDIKKDYEYTRGNLYSIIEKGQEALNGVLELAQESEMPRAYEVAGQLIKHVGDVADKLADLHKKVNEIENPKGSKTTEVTNNTMFVGSTAELAKFLKQKQDK